VVVYVVDSGCALGGVALGPSFVPLDPTASDPAQHGTNVAFLALATAPGANVTCVKVFDASLRSTVGQTVQALAWAADDCAGRLCVVVFAGGAPAPNAALDQAAALVANRSVLVAAAGNYVGERCLSPAAARSAISVGAVTGAGPTYTYASYSAFGPCVDALAPGVWGTSEAAAVAGGAAALWMEREPWRPPLQLRSAFLAALRVGHVVQVPPNTTPGLVGPPPPWPAAVFDASLVPQAWPAAWHIANHKCGFLEAPFSNVHIFWAGCAHSNQRGAVELASVRSDGLVVTTYVGGAAVAQQVDAADTAEKRRATCAWNGTHAMISLSVAGQRISSVVVGAVRPAFLSFVGGEGVYRNFTAGRCTDDAGFVPLLSPCALRGTPTTCAQRPPSRLDARCVWAGGTCRPWGFCGYASARVCQSRYPVCRWARGACGHHGR
jgi:subtilisin family serine protease